MAQFATFITQKQTETETVLIPLAPFIGNCFNILFYNGAGCYYVFDHLKEFFDVVKGENKLLSAVFHDLQVSYFKAGCRALGLIDKFVTGPLW